MCFSYLTSGGFFLAVAFRLYDLRGTGSIEREEVCIIYLLKMKTIILHIILSTEHTTSKRFELTITHCGLPI